MISLLIDADVTLYEVCTASERAIDWGDDMWTLHTDMKECKQRFDCRLANFKEMLGADFIYLAFSDRENWRKKILPTYKQNRKAKRKPFVYAELKKYAEEVYKAYQLQDLEGDDVLGLLAPKNGGMARHIKGDRIIVSIDKDMKTVPGLHFDPNKPEEGIVEVSEDQADYNHMLQTLTGDVTDGYKGCPGVGPKKAEKILKQADPRDRWGLVTEAYENAGLTEEDALLQARVARILRWGEYNTTKQGVKLWNP